MRFALCLGAFVAIYSPSLAAPGEGRNLYDRFLVKISYFKTKAQPARTAAV